MKAVGGPACTPRAFESPRTDRKGTERRRILLVDDDSGVRTSLGRALESEEYVVITAANGNEAVERSGHDDVDLVLLDVCLPDKTGWDVFARINAGSPFLPVIIITARSDQYEQAAAAGATAIMEKPLSFPLLMETMQRVLEEPAVDRVRRIALHQPLSLAGVQST